MLEAIETDLGIAMPHDNKNSGQTLSQRLAERDAPVSVGRGLPCGVR